MSNIKIFKDHILFDHDSSKHPSIDGLSLSKIADITVRGRKYSGYLLRTQKMQINKMTDYEGIPLEDIYEISFNAADSSPSISVIFHSTSDIDHDYVATVRKKDLGNWSKCDREIRFKIYWAYLKRSDGNAEAWFQEELKRLKTILDDLDRAELRKLEHTPKPTDQ